MPLHRTAVLVDSLTEGNISCQGGGGGVSDDDGGGQRQRRGRATAGVAMDGSTLVAVQRKTLHFLWFEKALKCTNIKLCLAYFDCST